MPEQNSTEKPQSSSNTAIPVLVILTIGSVFSSIIFLKKHPDFEELAVFGSYFGGLGTAIAILWIVYNATLQARSIKLQSDELLLQRQATQKIANSTETATILSLIELSEKSIEHDLKQLTLLFSEQNGDEAPVKTDELWMFALTNKRFLNWLSDRYEYQSIGVLGPVSSICRKYETLLSLIEKMTQSNEVKNIALVSSRLSNLYRHLNGLPQIKDQTVF